MIRAVRFVRGAALSRNTHGKRAVQTNAGALSRLNDASSHEGSGVPRSVTIALTAAALAAGSLALNEMNSSSDQVDGALNRTGRSPAVPSILKEMLFSPSVAYCDEADSAKWQKAMAHCIPAIVSIKVNATRSFDTSMPGASQATGFVVDAERGLILTNRHVVQAGPVVAEAVFNNHEEVPLKAVYRDPVHDFGIFKFDPKDLKHMPKVTQLDLHPEKAKVGVDIRVVGNNAGEKLTILNGTLARLDREAPFYGRNSYNDHNTFYFQAASSTSGGSSGSPVLNSDGEVVALNAAGKVGTAASFYLPLDRIKRALDLIKEDRPVTRGTLQTTFEHKPFNELRRLGLPEEVEAEVRNTATEDVGLLVVRSLVPGGPCQGILQPGDVLVRLNGELVTRFVRLEEVLDDAPGQAVEVEYIRGGKLMKTSVTVQDLHAITPSEFLELGESIFHDLSYHQARNHGLPVNGSGAYVAYAGYMLRRAGIPTGCLIQSVGEIPTPNARALENAFKLLPDGALVPVRYYHVSNRMHSAVGMLQMSTRWFPARRMVRDDKLGTWWAVPLSRKATAARSEDRTQDERPFTRFPPGTNDAEKSISHSLVQVRFSMPYVIDGTAGSDFVGTGVVVDKEKGLILVDRNTVPASLGDVSLSFGSSLEVPGKVLYIHPYHNLAVVQYDPSLIGDTPVKEATFSNSTRDENLNKKVTLVGLIGNQRTGTELRSQKASVSPGAAYPSSVSYPPRFQESNLDTLDLSGVGGGGLQDGVVVDDKGEVVAFWGSFSIQIQNQGRLQDAQTSQGITSDVIMDIVKPLKEGKIPVMKSTGAEFEYIGLSQVRGMGLDNETIRKIEMSTKQWPPKLLAVRRRWGDTPALELLQDGDVVLSVNGQQPETLRELERQVNGDDDALTMEILRGGHRKTVSLPLVKRGSDETTDVLLWGGAALQAPPQAVSQQWGVPSSGVYIASLSRGSPAHWHRLNPTAKIIEVDGEPTPTLEKFLRLVKSKKNGELVRITQEGLHGNRNVTTVQLDQHYWPSYEVLRNSKDSASKDNSRTWDRRRITPEPMKPRVTKK